MKTKENESNSLLVTAGYVCAILSLVVIPPVLALAGFVIGIVNLTKDETKHGIAQIIISPLCGIIGMLLGAMAESAI